MSAETDKLIERTVMEMSGEEKESLDKYMTDKRPAPSMLDAVIENTRALQAVIRDAMQLGADYGPIPGCGDKMVLLLPGAQKLCQRFALKPRYRIKETYHPIGDGLHKTVRVTCVLERESGDFAAEGVGECSTLESKYRWRKGERTCPRCQAKAIIKGKVEYGGGWVCFKTKGGCGQKWPDGSPEIEKQNAGRAENPDPADNYNTVLKMSKKRAYVDATISAVKASEIFSQDIGDNEEEAPAAKPAPAEQPATPPQAAATPPKPPVRLDPAVVKSWEIALTNAAKESKAMLGRAWKQMNAIPNYGPELCHALEGHKNTLKEAIGKAEQEAAAALGPLGVGATSSLDFPAVDPSWTPQGN